MIRLIGLGAGGHAKAMIDIFQLRDEYELVGLLDPDPRLLNTGVLGVPVIGNDDLLPDLLHQGITHVFNGLGSIGNTRPRQSLYEKVRGLGFTFVSAIHPQAIIARSATIGDGATIMAGAIICAGAHLAENVVINTGVVIEHDCTIGAGAFVATGAKLAGTVTVAEGAHIGLGAAVRQNIHIGSYAIVGAGAVVIKDVPDGATVVGVPARLMKRTEE